MTSVVIAAHNEAAVIGRFLDTLLYEVEPDEFDVTVVANGCTDDTAAIAAAHKGVRVLELPAAGKVLALNAGDEVAQGFPRIYLDADILLTKESLRALVAALDEGALAATLRRELYLVGRPLPVRAYYAIHGRLPALRDGLFGRGVIALSEAGRARFGRFPELVADDLFLDSLFTTAEKTQVTAYASRIGTPTRTRDLIRRLARVRAGNAKMRAAAAAGEVPSPVRDADRTSWLRDVVLSRPSLAPAAICYVAITVIAAVSAKRAKNSTVWGRDESSRETANS
jgi:glycosyltransferase involved in cell wall biosynthesis